MMTMLMVMVMMMLMIMMINCLQFESFQNLCFDTLQANKDDVTFALRISSSACIQFPQLEWAATLPGKDGSSRHVREVGLSLTEVVLRDKKYL